MKRTSRRKGPAALRGDRPAPRSLAPPPPPPSSCPPASTGAEALPLARAQAHWLTGDWRALAELDEQAVARHPQRDRLALLVACAHQQRASHERARDYTRKALAWGCDPHLVARLLVSGLHNTLGRIGALKGDDTMLETHFRRAMGVTGERDSHAATHGRALREMATLGLLPQAAGLLQGELDALQQSAARPAALAARVDMLRSEVELLQHELSLAQQRNQLLPRSAGGADEAADASREAQLRRLSPSQLGQDLWVLERSGYKRNGYFVEFGATDGVRLSNTYLLETEFGWRGICAEPNPKMYAQLKRNRRCTVSDACVGARTGELVDFVLAEEYGGMVRDIDSDMHAAKREAYYASESHRAAFATMSLHDLLTRLGAPREIDYLSVDTEGSEFEILAAFPFDQWNVRLLTVEHNFSSARESIRALLASRGYRWTECSHDDFFERTT